MLEVRHFDPLTASASQWAQLHAYRRRRAEEDEPGEQVLSNDDFRNEACRRWPLYESRRLVALQDGELVGNLGYGFRRKGTPDYTEFERFARAWGGVRRAWRRRGVATALLGPLSAFMRNEGKTILTLGSHLAEGQRFLAAIGAVEKQRSVENRLSFGGLDDGELARWEAAIMCPHAGSAANGLQWELHVGRVPMGRPASLQAQFTELLGDVPVGALELPRKRSELPGYVAWYEQMDRYGGDHFLALLTAGDQVAGLCEAGWDARFPDRVFQTLTAVARPWRGRGLGKALKAAMLRLIRERRPNVHLMITGNAEVNAPMLSINRRLGFVVHRINASYQIGVDVLAGWLATRPPLSATGSAPAG